MDEKASSCDIIAFVKNHPVAILGAFAATSLLVVGGVLWCHKKKSKVSIVEVLREDIPAPEIHEAEEIEINRFEPLMKCKQFQEIHFAACVGNVFTLSSLITENPELVHTTGPFAITPLMFAAGNGHDEAVKLLIEKGGLKPLGVFDVNHMTALCYASFYGHSTTTKILLELIKKQHGARALTDQYFMQSTPLHCAIQEKQYAIARLLLQEGVCVESTDRFGKTALHLAVQEKAALDIVVELLKASNDCNKLTREGLTALDIAQSNKAYELEKALIAVGALTSQELSEKDAQEKLEDAYIRWLTGQYGDINVIHGDGFTFLDKARHNGYSETEMVLLKYGAKTAQQVRESK